jgi:hypothetical protein
MSQRAERTAYPPQGFKAPVTPLVKKIPALCGNVTFTTVIKNPGDWTPYPQQDTYSPHPRDMSTFQIRNTQSTSDKFQVSFCKSM